ncbi:hypothetical protein CY0110_15712 [Crocosphaera chwakensis CCY0110]|uniref:Uncharacterized protein n=1 Tax=Crocosphaera chwakensis CCY0110 TaxID=391612 RepID=A3IHH4_9CHRO|nr:hypothetical protein CY0110_15712 [Crocosphaera chwakensis CCY0110]
MENILTIFFVTMIKVVLLKIQKNC